MPYRKLPVLTALLLTSGALSAQAATLANYGSSCPGNVTLQSTGLPRLGQTVTFPYGCVGWTTGLSSGASFLMLGLSAQNVPFQLPGFTSGTGCTILISPDIALPGCSVTIPNQSAYLGLQFFIQQVSWSRTTTGGGGPGPGPGPVTTWSIGFSDGVACTIGL